MSSLFDYYLIRNTKLVRKFEKIEYWLEMLKKENSDAIHYLFQRIMPGYLKIAKSQRLSEVLTEELLNDCIVLFIQKLQNGQFVYRDIDPVYYLLEIARRNVKNYSRAQKKYLTSEITDELEYLEDDTSIIENTCSKLDHLLKCLSPICEQLIRLKYIQEMKDAKIIELKLTPYSSVDVLKNQRARCFKKLLELAKFDKTN